MEFTSPVSGFTVYGKTGCAYCDKVKAVLDDNKQEFTYVNCDEYLIHNKYEFLNFITNLAGKDVPTFPIVFSSGKFVGGYTDTIRLLLNKYD